MHLGERIAELRKQSKMTQRELAERLNVSDKVISKWETGKGLPDVEAMLRLSKVLEVSISELYECVEKTDTQKMEEYNEERVWQYKKYSIVSCFLVILAPLIFLLMNANITGNNNIRHVFGYILTLFAIALFTIGLLFQITQFIRLYSYSKTKFYQDEYKRVLKKYGIIFLACLSPLVAFIIIIVFINLLSL